MKFQLSISRAVGLFGLVTVAGFAAVVLTGTLVLRELKVNGPLYAKIKLGNDLVADILPPPAYVIESYLEATLALREPSTLSARRERLVRLRKDYDERRAFLASSELDPALKTDLIQASHAEVQRFWAALDGDLLPALERKDAAAAGQAYAKLTAIYGAHRAVIDRLVEGATKENARLEGEAAAIETTFSWVNWTVVVAVLLVVVLGLWAIARGVVRPIGRMTQAMQSLAQGDLAVEIPFRARRDEVGAMAAAMQVFKEAALENARMREAQARAEAEAALAKKDAMQQMAQTVENETGSVVSTVATAAQNVDSAAADLAVLAHNLSGESQAVAAASEQALASAQTVSAAAEEMNASIREIAQQVARASVATRQAVERSGKAQETIQSLSSVVAKIAEVTSLIGGIAGQTNLLALNATIEAARAGEAGRGFAVVASEVKSLSHQTAHSTEEIARLIADVQAATSNTVESVRDIGAKIVEIDQVAAAVAAAIEEQGAATNEIARNVSESAAAAHEVSAKIANVSRDADGVNGRAAAVRSAIGEVAANVATLQSVLVRVVRTSTEDADRRSEPRREISIPARVRPDAGGALEATVVDISRGGAHLACAHAMGAGESGELSIGGCPVQLRFVVRDASPGALHVAFDLADGVVPAFGAWLEPNLGRRQAA